MADAGQMLSQLWSNNPIQSFIAGAQIKANLDSIALRQQQQVFDQQFQFQQQQDKQAAQAASMVVQSQELAVHAMNAVTERMFADQKLDPTAKALNTQLLQARINSLNNKGNDPSKVTYDPPAVGASGPQVPTDPGLPAQGPPMPTAQGPSVPTNPNPVSATGAPGLIPPFSPQTAAQVPTSMQASLQAPTPVPAPAAPPQTEVDTNAYLKDMTALNADIKAHTTAFDGHTPKQSLADPSVTGPERTSAEKIMADHSQFVQKYAAPQTPGSGQPTTVPSDPAAKGAPTPVKVESGSVQPTNGIVNRGNSTGYQITRDADGINRMQEYHWDGKPQRKPDGTIKPGDWKPVGEPKALKVEPPKAPEQPSTVEHDGITYTRTEFKTGKNGEVTGATYKANKSEGTAEIDTMTAPDGTKYNRLVTSKGGERFEKVPEPKVEKLKVVTTQDEKYINGLIDDANNTDKKIAAFGKKPSTDDEWRQAYNKNSGPYLDKVRQRIEELDKAGYAIPSAWQKYLPMKRIPAPSGDQPQNDTSGLSKYKTW